MTDGSVTVIGAGYVGLVTATLLAETGLKVFVLDVDKAKITKITGGQSPFFEPGLDELIKSAVSKKHLIATTDYGRAVKESRFVFCCVGTPDRPDGSSNLDYVFDALQTAAKHAGEGTVFIQKSTVPVGTARRLIKAIKQAAPQLQFHYVSNPEFLREGSAIHDTLYPDRTVLGGEHRPSLDAVAALYKRIMEAAPHIDPVLQKEFQKTEDGHGNFIYTTLESAELIKVTANAFLALKISFANSIAKLADQTKADINEVMDGVGYDRRIGRAFFNSGRGYGGGCFPKDVSGLIATAQEAGVELGIMQAAVKLNASMPGYTVERTQQALKKLGGRRLAVLGLAFKAGTSDTRKSPAIVVANALAAAGAQVVAYDPQAIIEDTKLDKSIKRVESLALAVKGADGVVLATDWPEFLAVDWARLKQQMSGNVVVDAMNALDQSAIEAAGLRYFGIGRGGHSG